MARAQNSNMDGSTSPSSLIQTACFLVSWVMTESVAVFVESTGVIDVVSAKQNAASTKRVEKIRSNNFIPSIYEDFGLKSAKFREKLFKMSEGEVSPWFALRCSPLPRLGASPLKPQLSHEFDFSNEKSFFSEMPLGISNQCDSQIFFQIEKGL